MSEMFQRCKLKSKAVIALVVVLATVGALPTALAAGSAPTPGSAVKPQLLLFHGGSFLFRDPGFEARTRRLVVAAGFEPHYVDYPLGDLPAAVAFSEGAALRLDEEFGKENVYAYGSSAGGDLAAILAGKGLVTAAAAKAPPSDLVAWTWPLHRSYGREYREKIASMRSELHRYSPFFDQDRRRLLIVQGVADTVVPPPMNETFARRQRLVRLWRVPGGHFTDRARPHLVARALAWLKQSGVNSPGDAPPTPDIK